MTKHLKIYDPATIANDDDDQLYYILTYDCDNKKTNIVLSIVSKNGDIVEDSNILIILREGKVIMLLSNLSDSVPLKTDLYGHALVYEQKDIDDYNNIMVQENMKDLIRRNIEKNNDNDEKNTLKH